ncbi:MAG: hypothetical protein NVS2B14_14130 [Chamaesiphon sp.]
MRQLNIATSALYLLAASSTPEEARTRALALAEEGVHITHKLAKELVTEHKPKKSSLDKDSLIKNKEQFEEHYPFKPGDLVELINPPPEAGWSPGDRVYLDDVDYEARTVLLKLDPNQIGRVFRSFSFDEVRFVDTSKPQRALLPSVESEDHPPSHNVTKNYSVLRDEELRAAFIARKQELKLIKQDLQAIKQELTFRHSSQSQRSHNSTATKSYKSKKRSGSKQVIAGVGV